MSTLSYKHIEITTRPEQSNMVEGKVAFFLDNSLYNFSYISHSEAECLVELNKYVAAFGKRLQELKPE